MRISRILENEYIVARKSMKHIWKNTIEVEVNSITTTNSQRYIWTIKMLKIKEKRVALVDDVISTGQSLKALEGLVEKLVEML